MVNITSIEFNRTKVSTHFFSATIDNCLNDKLPSSGSIASSSASSTVIASFNLLRNSVNESLESYSEILRRNRLRSSTFDWFQFVVVRFPANHKHFFRLYVIEQNVWHSFLLEVDNLQMFWRHNSHCPITSTQSQSVTNADHFFEQIARQNVWHEYCDTRTLCVFNDLIDGEFQLIVRFHFNCSGCGPFLQNRIHFHGFVDLRFGFGHLIQFECFARSTLFDVLQIIQFTSQ